MSENIRGITFAEQAVTPADDAIVRRAILGDGILTGCEISYSGSTLTMAPGYIIACGRSFQITFAQNWAVVDATSGFARLVLTIDLTKTATESAFNQIDFSVEYASAEDGFVALVQDDINISGTKYQVMVTMVSLGTGGITGIVSKLEQTAGGGAAINFDVKAYATKEALLAAVPKENTIGVITTTPIAGWIFSSAEPAETVEGMVWFPTGTSSVAEFNALKKNAIQVYPMSAKQYVDGVLVDRTAYSYRGGAWTEWVFTLYDAGKENTSALGANGFYRTNGAGTVTKTSSGLVLNSGTTSDNCIASHDTPVDVTNYKRLKATVNASAAVTNGLQLIAISDVKVAGSGTYLAQTKITTSGTQTVELNIDSFTGSKYIILTAFNTDCTYKKVWLE